MEQTNSGVDDALENDDLRAALTSALQGATTETVDAPSLEPPATTDDPIAAEAAAERARDDKGRFAKQAEEAAQAASTGQEHAKPVDPAAQTEQQTGQPAAVRPPPGWSPLAKSEFDKAHPAIREAVIKREEEVNRGLSKLAEYKGLDNYVSMARSAGTDLPTALERYVAAEQFLEKSPEQGLLWLAQTYGVTPQRLMQAMGGQQVPQPETPYQTGLGQAQPDFIPPAVQQQLAAISQTVESLQQDRISARMEQVNSALESFLNDPANKYAENVAGEMEPLIKARRASNPKEAYSDTLKWAYQKASWANDEVRELLIKERDETKTRQQAEAVQKARAASRSVVGSPLPGAAAGTIPAENLRDEIARNFGAGRV